MIDFHLIFCSYQLFFVTGSRKENQHLVITYKMLKIQQPLKEVCAIRKCENSLYEEYENSFLLILRRTYIDSFASRAQTKLPKTSFQPSVNRYGQTYWQPQG